MKEMRKDISGAEISAIVPRANQLKDTVLRKAMHFRADIISDNDLRPRYIYIGRKLKRRRRQLSIQKIQSNNRAGNTGRNRHFVTK
jgi:hypothetical protein